MNNYKVYVEKENSSEILNLKKLLGERNRIIQLKDKEIIKIKEEMEILTNSNEIERLNNAYLEMKNKFNLEKNNVIKLGDILGEKDELIKQTSSRIHEKNSIIEKFQNDLRNSVSKEEWNSLQNKMQKFIQENSELTKKIKKFQHENTRLKNLQINYEKNQINLQNDLNESQIKKNETMDNMEKLEKELEKKRDELKNMREYIDNMQNLQNKRNIDSTQLEKEMETQINHYNQMQNDLKEEINRQKLELEKLYNIIDEKDEIIRKFDNQSNDYDSFGQEEIKFQRKIRNNEFEYERNGIGYQHDPEEEYHSIMTLKSVQPKQGLLSEKNNLIHQNEKIKLENENLKNKIESLNIRIEELIRNTEKEKINSEYNSNSLKETIRRLEDDLEELMSKNRKIKNKFEDHQGDGEWWKNKFKELESQYKELINKFEIFTESSNKHKKFLEKNIKEKEIEIEKMEEQLNNIQNEQNKKIFGILGELKNKNQGNDQNKEMLKEVITKVNELFKRSKIRKYIN